MVRGAWWLSWARVLVVLSLTLVPAVGAADWDDDDDSSSSSGGDCGAACAVGAVILVSLPEAAFLTADVVYLAQGKWFGPFGGWTETLWGAGHVLVGVVAVPAGLYTDDSSVVGFGIGASVLGTWFMAS